MSKAYDFKAWLETNDAAKTYNFLDSRGQCLVGQYMASKGEEWDFYRYVEYVTDVLGSSNTLVLQSEPQTFGGALDRLNKVHPEPARCRGAFYLGFSGSR
jgi:hypothetical protein